MVDEAASSLEAISALCNFDDEAMRCRIWEMEYNVERRCDLEGRRRVLCLFSLLKSRRTSLAEVLSVSRENAQACFHLDFLPQCNKNNPLEACTLNSHSFNRLSRFHVHTSVRRCCYSWRGASVAISWNVSVRR